MIPNANEHVLQEQQCFPDVSNPEFLIRIHIRSFSHSL